MLAQRADAKPCSVQNGIPCISSPVLAAQAYVRQRRVSVSRMAESCATLRPASATCVSWTDHSNPAQLSSTRLTSARHAQVRTAFANLDLVAGCWCSFGNRGSCVLLRYS